MGDEGDGPVSNRCHHNQPLPLIVDSTGCAFCLGDRIVALEAEVERLRDTNRNLNRRVQLAESAVAENVEACRRAGVSLGRVLANAAVAQMEAENEWLRAKLASIASVYPCYAEGCERQASDWADHPYCEEHMRSALLADSEPPK